jgi:calcineurin-like phosphoesterase family protein
MQPNEFISSDTHFGHANIIEYARRPFPERPDYTAGLEAKVHKGTATQDEIKSWKRWLRQNVQKMDEELIRRWNAKVPQGAVVYHLGDFGFMDPDKLVSLIKRLNGTIRLIRGNHDKVLKHKKVRECFEWVREYYESKTKDGTKIVMCHYPFMTWNGSHRGAWNLHGHCHGSLKDTGGRRLDVGVDTHPNHEPYSFYEVQAFMRNREHQPVDHHR